MRVRLERPADFAFRRTVMSHGWWTLPPFSLGERGSRLETAMALPGGGAVPLSVAESRGVLTLQSAGRPEAALRRELVAAAGRMLNLDLDLAGFYRATAADPRLGGLRSLGAGRMLRCPTVFEDLVKLVLTTNCSWAHTTQMVTALVQGFGESTPDGRRAFPGPETIAEIGERGLRRRVRAGYRSPLLARLARLVADGQVRPDEWEAEAVDDPRGLHKRLLELPGVGPYVADNVVRLFGRPAGLGLDSWLRAKYAEIYHEGRRVTDRTIGRRYARFGPWAGLALWCDMTDDWFDGDEPSAERSSW